MHRRAQTVVLRAAKEWFGGIGSSGAGTLVGDDGWKCTSLVSRIVAEQCACQGLNLHRFTVTNKIWKREYSGWKCGVKPKKQNPRASNFGTTAARVGEIARYWERSKSAKSWVLGKKWKNIYPMTNTDKKILGQGYNFRVTIINALNAMQPATHWTRLVSLLAAEALTRGDPVAWCYSIPVTEKEKEHLVKADAAGILSADAARKKWWGAMKEYLLNLCRLVWLWIMFAPVLLSAPISLGHGYRRSDWMVLLRRTLERCGPAFIKWGQWAATRADLFPPDMCWELEKLHSDAPAHAFSVTEETIERSFGFPLGDLFSEFDKDPVASGSIGQIHKARVSSIGSRLTGMQEGAVVAVKVRHPGVTESIQRDFALMTAVARALNYLPALQNLRLEESLKQFAAPLREQVDLSREGYYLHAFNYNFRKESTVRFPVPLYPLVSPAVLVETFEDGCHISSYVAKGAGAPYNTELAQIGAHAMLHMMVVDNLVHSDLHPGNILVTLKPVGGNLGLYVLDKVKGMFNAMGMEFDSTKYFKPSIILLDAGMCTQLSSEDQVNMFGLFEAFSRLDPCDIADWVLRFAADEQTCPDPEQFKSDLTTHFNELKRRQMFVKGSTSSGAEALAAVLEMVRLHQVSLPGHICATVVTTLVLEGWSHELDPAHSTLNEVKRIIALKKGETKARKIATWVQQAAVDREILEHVPPFIAAKHEQKRHY